MPKRKAPDLCDQLREAIRADGRTAYVLEHASGVRRPQITRFLLGERDITLTTAARLATALGLRLAPIEAPE